MYTTIFAQEIAKVGEQVCITFTIKDNSGAAVLVTGLAASFKISRRAGDTAFLSLTQVAGITLTGSTAVVLFNTNTVLVGTVQALGDLFAQLSITKAGNTLYVAEGIITILPVNS